MRSEWSETIIVIQLSASVCKSVCPTQKSYDVYFVYRLQYVQKFHYQNDSSKIKRAKERMKGENICGKIPNKVKAD